MAAAGGAWVAAAAGLAIAALVPVLGPTLLDTRPAAPQPWEAAAAQGLVWPFSPANATGDLLLWAPYGPTAAANGLGAEGAGLQWWSERLAVRPGPARGQCPCAGPGTAVQATAYVFAEGRLLGSNAPEPDASRFQRHGRYTGLPYAWWALGEPAPPGAAALPPEWQDPLRPALERLAGLGAGDVLTVQVADHPYAGSVGPLAVTLRIDAVAPAARP